MKLCVNDEVIEFDGRTLGELVVHINPETPFAVAVNTAFVARKEYGGYVLQEQDKVDIVSPVAGG